MFDDPCYKIVGGGIGGSNQLLNVCDGDDGILIEMFEYAVSITRSATKLVDDELAVLLTQ